MGKKYLIGNWKSHQNNTETILWLEEFKKKVHQIPNEIKVILALPFTDISGFNHRISEINLPIFTAAQNVSHLSPGKHTGEVTASMLSELVTHCIIGHSERRREFSETCELVSQKAKALLENSITPIICLDTPYLTEQIKSLFHYNIDVASCFYVYEPISAIGTGVSESPENANQVAHQISFLVDNNAPILYGGSVNADNVSGFLNQNKIDGVLVGTDSLDPVSFAQILANI